MGDNSPNPENIPDFHPNLQPPGSNVLHHQEEGLISSNKLDPEYCPSRLCPENSTRTFQQI